MGVKCRTALHIKVQLHHCSTHILLQYNPKTAVHFFYCSTITLLQYTFLTAVQSHYCSSRILLQCNHTTAVQVLDIFTLILFYVLSQITSLRPTVIEQVIEGLNKFLCHTLKDFLKNLRTVVKR